MKVDKYDRQIRIWGAKGQKRLSESKVGIIGCSGAAIETAKNLILPGVGRIDILDDKIIEISDLSTSFFYSHDSVGRYKGQQASKNLLQMNPDVQGSYIKVSIKQIIQSPSEYLQHYDLIICANLKQDQNKALSKKCWELSVAAIFITSVGFFFHVKSQKQQHIVESQNVAGKKYYLRLHDPFEGLKKYVEEKNLMGIVDRLKQINHENSQQQQKAKQLYKQFGKITYPVFLVEAYNKLKSQLEHQPKSSEVKQLLHQWRNLVPEDLDIRSGVNQAIQRTFDLYQTIDNFLPDMGVFDIPQSTEQQEKQTTQRKQNNEFIQIFLKAVKKFIGLHNNSLPQIVRLPDISTSTKDYIELKNIYKQQHAIDKQQLRQIIRQLEPGYLIDEQLLSQYINNIDALKILTLKPYYMELQNPDVIGSCLEYSGDEKQIFIALRAFNLFQQQHQYLPKPDDFQKVNEIAQKLALKYGLSNIDERFIKQICRYEGKTLMSYDSMAGSVAGQQAVKLLTGCFEPLNGGFYFDGLACRGYTIRL